MNKEVPSIKIKDEFVNSSDIKRQLSQSMGTSGGISKPTSRRGSIVPNDDDDDDEGNERKRRDNINEKIQELLTLVPSELFNDNNKTEDIDLQIKNSGTKDGKPNKGQILTKSVEYIQYLQNKIDENNRKEVEMLVKLRYLTNGDKTISHTSAEKALGEIGVGPLSQDYFKAVLVGSANANKARKSSV
ncbi:retrograde regulation protein 1 [[Candida] jaroonii]|uniref:Retrograde regulation protein 1 n=1 Tax=[Candida] jaroonii TaxID=467808 RepID=A0ACA9Y7F3_9ASCO|nr:retrograde regulation protein 1 [[Candida] jaroonii]